MATKPDDFLKNIQNFDLSNPAVHLAIMTRDLSQEELKLIMRRIKDELLTGLPLEDSTMLKQLRKQLKQKYSISLSNAIIHTFVKSTSCKMLHRSALNFCGIDREIKSSIQEIQKKKYCLDKTFGKERKKKLISAEKRKRRNVLYSTVSVMPICKSSNTLDVTFIRDKLFILKEYLPEEDFEEMEGALVARLDGINETKYGDYADKIKNYTVYDAILQKIFSLIQEDTRNIEIRQKYQKVYKKMKEEMVSIVTNEDQVELLLKKVEKNSTKPRQANRQNKQISKKNYYQLEKDKQDLTAQIEETINTAKKSIKDALIKRGRPDYAYQMELSLENRRTPFNRSRV